MSQLTDLLRSRMQQQRLTQMELALRLNTDRASVNRILMGDLPLTAKMAVRFECALGVPAVELLQLQAPDQVAEVKRKYGSEDTGYIEHSGYSPRITFA